jgi:hypothetical protein
MKGFIKVPPGISAVMQTALRAFLDERHFRALRGPGGEPFHLLPTFDIRDGRGGSVGYTTVVRVIGCGRRSSPVSYNEAEPLIAERLRLLATIGRLRDVGPGIPLPGVEVRGGVRARTAIEAVRRPAAGEAVVAVGPAQNVTRAQSAERVVPVLP